MNITQENLKLLAEWYYGKTNIYDYTIEKAREGAEEFRAGNIRVVINVSGLVFQLVGESCLTLWQPHADSNQLDMLEDKMIEKEHCHKIILWERDGERIKAYYYRKHWDTEIKGEGSTKNEARLNAILTFIKEMK